MNLLLKILCYGICSHFDFIFISGIRYCPFYFSIRLLLLLHAFVLPIEQCWVPSLPCFCQGCQVWRIKMMILQWLHCLKKGKKRDWYSFSAMNIQSCGHVFVDLSKKGMHTVACVRVTFHCTWRSDNCRHHISRKHHVDFCKLQSENFTVTKFFNQVNTTSELQVINTKFHLEILLSNIIFSWL